MQRRAGNRAKFRAACSYYETAKTAAPIAEEFGVTSASLPFRPGTSIDAIAPLTPSAWLRYDLIQRMLPVGVADILEVGCGQGALAARLVRRYNYLGVELDQASWSVARERLAVVGAGQVRNISFDDLGTEQFDLVCAFEVLEHIENDAAAVKEWATKLRDGGWLLLSVPAYQDRFGPADELVGHFRRYDPGAITALLSSCGFTDILVEHYGMPLGYLLEAGRNLISKRRLGRAAPASAAERTATSGRMLQPSGLIGVANRWVTTPFRVLQRAFPRSGTGLVVRARLRPPADH
jgi:SAM-dependent methyltransferase